MTKRKKQERKHEKEKKQRNKEKTRGNTLNKMEGRKKGSKE